MTGPPTREVPNLAPPIPVVDDLGALLTALSEHAADYPADASRNEVVADLQLRWSEARLRILLVGEAKRGKSTVGNAMLGRQVLPTGVVPLTAVTTTVTTGTPERLMVHGIDGSHTSVPLAELANYVTEIGNPDNERGVANAVVFLADGLPHRSVDLVDTPGVGSVYRHNTEAAELAMARMDIAIFVATADPPISAAEYSLLARVNRRCARTYVVLNKVDQLDPQDRATAERFIRQNAAQALQIAPDSVPVFSLSAREALRARMSDDSASWTASGMQEFVHSLQSQLRASWRSDLMASIASTASREVAEMIDDCRVTLRSQELRAKQQAGHLDAFGACLADLENRRRDAAAAATAYLDRWIADLTDAAGRAVGRLTTQLTGRLDGWLAERRQSSAAELESAGRMVLTELIGVAVESWRQEWSNRLTEACAEAGRRQQKLLDESFDQIRQAASELLGVELNTPASRLTLPTGSSFRLDIEPDPGWNDQAAAVLRRRMPGRIGRQRMAGYLKAEAARLVDKHIGRVRADLHARLKSSVWELSAAADRLSSLRQQQLEQAISLGQWESGSDQASSFDRRLADLEGLADGLSHLLDSTSLTDHQGPTSD